MLPGCRANETAGALCGFGKQGLTTVAGAQNKDWAPKLTAAWKDAASCKAVLSYTFAPEAQTKYGAPLVANTTISVMPPNGHPDTDGAVEVPAAAVAGRPRLAVDVQYSKRQTRMAESLWVSFEPLAEPRGWRLDKLGRRVDPFDVVANGSRAMHAVWTGLEYYEPPLPPQASAPGDAMMPTLAIISLDAPVVAIDEPSPIVFLQGEQIEGKSWHFCCFNNAWNVNYPV